MTKSKVEAGGAQGEDGEAVCTWRTLDGRASCSDPGFGQGWVRSGI